MQTCHVSRDGSWLAATQQGPARGRGTPEAPISRLEMTMDEMG